MKVPTTASPPALEGEVIPKPVGVGNRLRNGALVLAVKPYAGAMPDTGIVVLALANQREFVTWVCYPDGSEAYWGHYFNTDIAAALRDYEARR